MLAEATETAPDQPLEDLSSEKSPESPKVAPRKAMGRPPKEILSPFDQLKLRDWDRTLVYLYRTAPLIDRTQSGDRKFICKYAAAFDEDQVMQEYGSGNYLARVTETTPGKNESKQVDQFSFNIMNLAYPPQVPLGQWIDDPRNDQWKWAKDLLEAKQRPQPASSPAQQPRENTERLVQTIAQELRSNQVDPTTQFKAMTDAHRSGIEQGLEVAKKTQPVASGESGMLEKLLPFLLTPKPQDDSVVKVLTLQLENEREQRKMDREQAKADREATEKRAESAEKRHSELMAIMLAKKDDSGTDVIEKFSKMFTMVNQIREGAGLGATDDSWTGLLKDGIREALPSLAPAVAPMLGGLLSSLPLGPRPPQQMQQQPQAAPPQQQAAAPAPPPQQDPHLAAYQFILQNWDTMMNKLQRQSGLEFGDWIYEGPGVLPIERLKAAGTERIIETMKQIPQAWEQLGPIEPRFRSFLNELMNWAPEEAGGDDEEAEPDPNIPVGKPVGTVEIIKPEPKKAGKKGKQ